MPRATRIRPFRTLRDTHPQQKPLPMPMDGETDVLWKDADCLRQAIQDARTRTRALCAVYGMMIAAPRAKGIAFLNCKKQGTCRSL